MHCFNYPRIISEGIRHHYDTNPQVKSFKMNAINRNSLINCQINKSKMRKNKPNNHDKKIINRQQQ